MEIRVDFDELMQFGGVFRTLSESLDRRAVTQLHFDANRIQQVVALYDLDVVSPAGGNLIMVRDDAVARSQRVADYLMSCSTDLFRHAGAVNQVDTGFDWAGLSWAVGDVIKESFQTVDDAFEVLEPFVKRFPDVFPALGPLGELWDGLGPVTSVISFPLDVIDYFEALDIVRDNPWEGWFEGIEAGLGITTGLILGAKVVFGAGAVATLLPAVPYLIAAGVVITVGVAAFEFGQWAFGDAAYWMGGVMYDTWSATTSFVSDAADAVADFGSDVVDGAQDLWSDTVDFGADAWNFVFGNDGVVDHYWDRAVDAVDEIESWLVVPPIGWLALSSGGGTNRDTTPKSSRSGADALLQITTILDDGNDYKVSDADLNDIQAILEGLSVEDLTYVMSQLTSRQRSVLSHNVHSHSIWSRDWDDSQRAEFYMVLNSLPASLRSQLEPDFPWIEVTSFDQRLQQTRQELIDIARYGTEGESRYAKDLLGEAGWDTSKERQFLSVDMAEGDHRIVEVLGDLGTVDKVIIVMNGINTDLENYMGGEYANAANTYEAANSGRYGDSNVAVVSFMDYNVPTGGWGAIPDLGEAGNDEGAKSGVYPLLKLIDDLHQAGFETEDLTIAAHSYGTVVVGQTMQTSDLKVNAVVALGSPGMGVNDRSDLGNEDVLLYAGETDDDVVPSAPAHGEAPGDPGFGSILISTEGAKGHSEYFNPNSGSLDSIARIAHGAELELTGGRSSNARAAGDAILGPVNTARDSLDYTDAIEEAFEAIYMRYPSPL